MTEQRIDIAGASWPLTRVWCSACGLPMFKVDEHDTHPGCDPEATT